MQYYYGSQMPLRVLDECEFWKLQESEHTVVIREAVQNLEQKYVDELKKWETALTRTHQRVIRFIETAVRSDGTFLHSLYQDLMQLVAYCLDESQQFIHFLNKLKQKSEPIKTNFVALTIMDHIIRESEYFIGVAQTILYQSKG